MSEKNETKKPNTEALTEEEKKAKELPLKEDYVRYLLKDGGKMSIVDHKKAIYEAFKKTNRVVKVYKGA